MRALRRVWAWVVAADWPMAILGWFLVTAATLSVFVAIGPSEAERDAALARRLAAAEAWVHANRLEATVTCDNYSSVCDVVPRDARAPLQIACSRSHCSLHRPSGAP